MARRYGDDLAIVWIDSHPDVGTPASQYPGFQAMAAALTGHGDPDVQELLPAIVSPDRVALVGLHAWANDDIANVAHWGIRSGPGRPARDDQAAGGLAGRDRLRPGRYPFRRRHHRQQPARAGPRR
ncbi:MAG: arginase family protein [Actinomycetes bacterium]